VALEHSDISRMLEVAVVAARLAGQRAMEEIKYTKVTVKNGGEIVTQADINCQQIILSRIKEVYPDHGFIAEEGPDGKMLFQPPRTAEPIWWIVDPIDGSNNYSHGLLDFAVSIAALHQGEPIVGVIFDPATESMYTAAKDAEAQLNASKITVGKDGISEFAGFGVDSHFNEDMKKGVYEIMNRTRFRNLGATALHLAYVAKGALIGTISTVTKIWDIAAGAIIIERAGGVLTDIKGKSIFPVEPDSYTGQQYRILAANKKTHPELLKIFS
jgi:myo-inositol-1(or 4)-monophosphatase